MFARMPTKGKEKKMDTSIRVQEIVRSIETLFIDKAFKVLNPNPDDDPEFDGIKWFENALRTQRSEMNEIRAAVCANITAYLTANPRTNKIKLRNSSYE